MHALRWRSLPFGLLVFYTFLILLKTNIAGTHQNHLIEAVLNETVLTSTHNLCFVANISL